MKENIKELEHSLNRLKFKHRTCLYNDHFMDAHKVAMDIEELELKINKMKEDEHRESEEISTV